MGRLSLLAPVAFVFLTGCATANASGVRPQRFTGWLFYRHEMMLFQTRRDYLAFAERHCDAGQKCGRPLCISGIFADEAPSDIEKLNGMRVTLTGRLISYRSLSHEHTPLLPRKVFGRTVVMDYCLRDDIILATTVAPA